MMSWGSPVSVVVMATVLSLSLAADFQPPSKEEFKRLILEKHNDLRSKEGGSDMNQLVWDDTLEREAENWANKCVFEHEMKSRGENLAFNTDMNWATTVSASMDDWFSEKNVYPSFGKSCGPTSACHYTQLVWAETRRVGCSLKRCQPLGNSGTSMATLYLVCFYDPRGNFDWDSEHPYVPGPACSKCLSDQTCSNGLCAGGQDPCYDKEDESKCSMWAKTMNQCTQNKAFMEKSCKNSCGWCKGGATGQPGGAAAKKCEDDDSRCPTWAGRGQCDKNPMYMKVSCKKSCNSC